MLKMKKSSKNILGIILLASFFTIVFSISYFNDRKRESALSSNTGRTNGVIVDKIEESYNYPEEAWVEFSVLDKTYKVRGFPNFSKKGLNIGDSILVVYSVLDPSIAKFEEY